MNLFIKNSAGHNKSNCSTKCSYQSLKSHYIYFFYTNFRKFCNQKSHPNFLKNSSGKVAYILSTIFKNFVIKLVWKNTHDFSENTCVKAGVYFFHSNFRKFCKNLCGKKYILIFLNTRVENSRYICLPEFSKAL